MTAVSVCIPSFARPDRLRRALQSLQAVTPPRGGFEVVVADDGSPRPDEVAEAVAAVHGPVPVRLEQLSRNQGPAAARNRAWRVATGDWIVFTDDDCTPTPDWLEKLMERAHETAASVVIGCVAPDPADAHLLERPWSRSVRVDGLDRYYRTCNIAYRRDLLEELGGFDEQFRHAAGEDTDLGWRAERAGAEIAFAADAVVYHDVTVSDWRSELRGRRRWADTVRVIAKHPESRSLSWHPYVYRKSHIPVLVLAAGAPLLLTRRGRPAFLLAAGSLLAADALRAGSPSRALSKVQSRTCDAWEVLLLARESVRERVLFL